MSFIEGLFDINLMSVTFVIVMLVIILVKIKDHMKRKKLAQAGLN